MSFVYGLLDWIPLGLPAFLFVITPIVFFHELGHFAMARAFGVKVEAFSIGFGPAIVGWTDRKGTRWKISWVPVGGYVKFFGDLDPASAPDREKLETLTPAERAETFPAKPLYQRALVVLAGPVANFILAMVIFTAIFMTFGVGTPSTVVGEVRAHAPAAQAGMQPGDRIVAMNGKKLATWNEIVDTTQAAKGQMLSVTIDRHGRPFTLKIQPRSLQTKDIYGEPVTYTGIGLGPSQNTSDLIMSRLGPVGAVAEAGRHVEFVVVTSLTYLWRIVTGHADSSQLTGPIGMMQASKAVAKRGFLDLLGLAAFISVSIGLVNLFPIPILDGGHLLYYGFEAAMGRPLNARAQDAGFRLGLAVVLGLFLLATFNDLVRPSLF